MQIFLRLKWLLGEIRHEERELRCFDTRSIFCKFQRNFPYLTSVIVGKINFFIVLSVVGSSIVSAERRLHVAFLQLVIGVLGYSTYDWFAELLCIFEKTEL